jgi:hypothetical protein
MYIKNWILIAVLRNWEQFQICSVFFITLYYCGNLVEHISLYNDNCWIVEEQIIKTHPIADKGIDVCNNLDL